MTRSTLGAGLATLAMVALTGCGSTVSASEDGQASASNSQSPGAAKSPSMSGPTPTPHSSNPFLACAGISGIDDAVKLVENGRTALVVTARITDQQQPESELVSEAPVASYTVLAGDALNGPVKEVEVTAAPGATVLAPGDYLLLLGTTPTSSRYFLSDGLAGSFEHEDGSAYQRCPNRADTAHPLTMRTGVTSVPELADLFAQAMAKVSGASPVPG